MKQHPILPTPLYINAFVQMKCLVWFSYYLNTIQIHYISSDKAYVSGAIDNGEHVVTEGLVAHEELVEVGIKVSVLQGFFHCRRNTVH